MSSNSPLSEGVLHRLDTDADATPEEIRELVQEIRETRRRIHTLQSVANAAQRLYAAHSASTFEAQCLLATSLRDAGMPLAFSQHDPLVQVAVRIAHLLEVASVKAGMSFGVVGDRLHHELRQLGFTQAQLHHPNIDRILDEVEHGIGTNENPSGVAGSGGDRGLPLDHRAGSDSEGSEGS